MICPLCRESGIRVVNPYWLNGKVVEACRACALKLNLREIDIKSKIRDGIRIPYWKAHTPAILK